MKLLSKVQHEIIELLKRRGCMSVDQITQELDLHKTAARRTLLALERRELLKREWIPVSRGRPQLGFSLTTNSSKLFVNKEGELLEALILYLQKHDMEQVVENFFEAYWQEKYRRIMKKIKAQNNRDLSSRLEILMSILEDDGFSPRAELSSKSSAVVLKECHCPISAAARITDIPCRIESRFIAKVLNVDANYRGDCEFELKPVKLPFRKVRR